jgi:ABC-2 type transport system permease protein
LTVAAGPIARVGHYRLGGVVRSEWTKLRTLRSTQWALVTSITLAVLLSALVCVTVGSSWHQQSAASHLDFDPTNQSLVGLLLGQLAIGVLGVLVITSEYSTGSIRTTLGAVPNRSRLFGAKAMVFGAVALVTGLSASLLSFLVGQALLSAPAPHASLTNADSLRAVVGGGLYLAVLGVLALGLGGIIRHSAGAIAAFAGLTRIVPWVVAQYLPNSVSNDVSRWMPANIGTSLTSTHSHVHEFSPWTGLGILCGYALVALTGAIWLMNRRDA